MLSMLAVPETISSSQARPRAMDLISAVRRSAFMGRARDLALEAGSRISLNRLAGGFVQGINSAEFSSTGKGGPVLSSAPSELGCISQTAKWLLRTSMRATIAEQIPALAERGRMRIQYFFAWLDVRLSDNEFVCGPHFTIADITGMVTVDFCGWAKLKASEHFGHLHRWHATVSARP